jgi:mono/diheme cytochrome c family protein
MEEEIVIRTLTLAVVVALGAAVMSPGQSAIESLYKSKCVSCHAADGSGNTPVGKKLGVHDFRSPEVQSKSDAELTQILKKGKGKMKGFGSKLSDQQTRLLIAYVRELGKKK